MPTFTAARRESNYKLNATVYVEYTVALSYIYYPTEQPKNYPRFIRDLFRSMLSVSHTSCQGFSSRRSPVPTPALNSDISDL